MGISWGDRWKLGNGQTMFNSWCQQYSVDEALVGEVQAPKQLTDPEEEFGFKTNELLSEELHKFMIGQDEDKDFQVGVQLPPREKTKLVAFLKDNVDVYAWSTYDETGVDPEFIFHQLNVNLGAVLTKQPRRCSSKKHAKVVKEEVNKLKQERTIKEVFYLEWLANTVVVKKKNEKWCVCVQISLT